MGYTLLVKQIAKISSTVIEFGFYSLVVLVPLAFTAVNSELFEFPKIVIVYSLTAIITISWLIKSVALGAISLKRSPLDWPIFLFFISQLLSTIFSVNLLTSIFGYYSRFNGGLLSTICYLILFYLALANLSRDKLWQLANLAILTGLVVALWGIPSHFGFDLSCKLITGHWSASCWSVEFQPTLRIFATLGQPNWLAAFLAMLIPAALFLGIASAKLLPKIYYLLTSLLLFLAFIFTNSRAAALGLGLALLTAFLVLSIIIFKKKESFQYLGQKTNLVLGGATLLGLVIIGAIFGQSLIGRVKLATSVISQSTTQTPATTNPLSGGTESGKIRFIVWQGAIDIFKHYPILGSGVETFGYTYYQFRPAAHNLTTEWNFLYNKAHNEYLNYLANTGILGLGSYLLLIAAIFWAAFKSFKLAPNLDWKLLVLGLSSGFLANLILNFFGFSVVTTSLFSFLYPAIIIGSSHKTKPVLIKVALWQKQQVKIGSIIAFILLAGFFLNKLANYWLADVAFAAGENATLTTDPQTSLAKYRQAVNLSPVPQPLYYIKLANAAADLAATSQDPQFSADYSQLAVTATQIALTLNQVNVHYWATASEIYLKLSLTNSDYLQSALQAAQIAANLAPTDPETNFQLAFTQRLAGFEASAAATLQKLIELKPDYQKAIDELKKLQSAH